MELDILLKIVRRWWWLIALPVLLVGAHVGVTYRPPAPTYQVVMRFAAGANPAGLSEDYDRYYAWLTSEYIANGLADVSVTGAFAEAVSARLAAQGIAIPPGAIQGALARDNAQSIAVIYLTWPDPEALVALAEAVTVELIDNATAYYPQLAEVGPPLRRLDAPTPAQLAPSLRAQLLGPALRLLIAGAIGVGLACLAYYLDPTIREREELTALGIPVVWGIPPAARR